MEDLKPCPFCGYDFAEDREDDYEDVIYPYNREKTLWNVSCSGCNSAYVLGYTKEEAIKLWNQRSN